MSKYCTVCGSQLPDDATFCTNCGAPQEAPEQPANDAQSYSAPQQPAGNDSTPAVAAAETMKNTLNNLRENVDLGAIKNSLTMENIKNLKTAPNKNTIIALCCVGVVVIAAIVILMVILFSGGYKKPVDKLIKSLETGEGKYLVEVLNEGEKQYLEENYVDNSKKYDSLEEYFDVVLESMQKSLEDRYGDDFSISYSISKKKEISDNMLKGYASAIKSEYGKKVDVSAGYNLSLEVNWKGDDKDEDGDKSITVIKADGDWVLYGVTPKSMMPSKLGGTNNGSGFSMDDMDLDDIDLGDIDLGDLDLGDFGF